MKKIMFTLVCLILFQTIATAQIEDLTKDSDFFQKQSNLYQRWLDHSGLGKLLKVHTIEVKPQSLSLYLAFHSENIDSVMNAWKVLKNNFDATHPIKLEQELFYKMVNLMEVRQSLADVQIYDTYDLRKEPLFFRGIKFENDKVVIEESNPKSVTKELYITPADFSKMKSWSVENFQQKMDKQTIYNKILQCARQRYEQKVCDQRYPKLRLLENQEVLRFEVIDLCREVLTDEANPTLCRILHSLGYDCNWVKREMLTFEITYQNTPSGFQLKIDIDGKYGSGLYESVRRGGYISMEIDFDDYLKRYADSFNIFIRDCIRK